VPGWILTRSGVTRVNDTDSSLRRRAAAIEDRTLSMEDEDISFTVMTVESRIVERHLGIRPAGVDGMHSLRMIQSLSGCSARERPRVE